MKKTILLMTFIAFISSKALAQNWSLSTNLVDYVTLATMNVEGSVAMGRHISVNASVRVNPWTFHKGDPAKQMQNRNKTYAAGIRYWPWHIYSGWWFSSVAQYQEYNFGGFFSQKTEEGDAFGLGIGAGYSLMVHEYLNVDFGLSLWGGQKTYVAYACPSCGRITDKGSKWFILPNEIRVAIQYIF